MNRRALLAGLAAACVAVAAGAYRLTDLFVKHYPPTPYDDLLTQLADREHAKRLGAAVRATPDAQHLAAPLRRNLKGGLESATQADIAAGRLMEVEGWLLPQSVALLSALAAKT